MATYIRLTDYKNSDEKEQEFFNPENRYEAKQEDFSKIPGCPISYWVTDKVSNIFNIDKVKKYAIGKTGIVTGNSEYYYKQWFEIEHIRIGFNYQNESQTLDCHHKWFPINNGGDTRKWYGNLNEVVNYYNGAEEIHNQKGCMFRNRDFYFKESINWNNASYGKFGVRTTPQGFIFSGSSPSIFPIKFKDIYYLLSFLNSEPAYFLKNIINSGHRVETGHLAKMPLVFPKQDSIKEQIENLTQQNINISKEEWNSRETSWDFTKNELIKHKADTKIETAYTNYCNYWKEQFNTLHQNEEELNRLFIDIYELQDELTTDVELKDITILKNEKKIIDGELVFQADEIMKQFISYGVGVMFGRYSLDSDGLLIANMAQVVPTSPSFEIDDDNVIPVLEDDYFKDDIASRFVQFVKATFGEEDLSENIRFIESSLGITLRKYFVKGFYEDHIKRYKKRPIYWMVASPKKGFLSLIYMHRYEEDTFGRVRNSYLTEYIAKLEAHKVTLTLTTSSDTASDRDKKDADKQMKNIDTKLKEIIEFDRDKMMSWSQNPTEIDLDDGVKVNYCRFKDILYPITGLCKK